jgi:hypothetical protein
VIARRTTYDGVPVQLWSDGTITAGPERANHYVAKHVDRRVLWLVAGDVALYDESELKKLVAGARKALDMHVREPWRVPEHELRRLMRVYANVNPRRAA